MSNYLALLHEYDLTCMTFTRPPTQRFARWYCHRPSHENDTRTGIAARERLPSSWVTSRPPLSHTDTNIFFDIRYLISVGV
jgi:hypothetical protein